MNCSSPPGSSVCHPRVIVHHLVCQHRVEVEVWPALAEVYFQNERYVDPVNTKVQFDAAVYNGPTNLVTWRVNDPKGAPGLGTIDDYGLYVAPKFNPAWPYGITEIITATAVDDPSRQAYARVALMGRGPEPKPDPKIEIFPKKAYLYYDPATGNNDFIDVSNTRQFFRANLYCSPPAEVDWFVGEEPGWDYKKTGWWYLFDPDGQGVDFQTAKVTARLKDKPQIRDEAIVVMLNYAWPGIIHKD